MRADLSSQKLMAIDAHSGKAFSRVVQQAYQKVYRISLKSQKKLVPQWLTDARIEIANTEAHNAETNNEKEYQDTTYKYYENQEGE